MTLLRARMQMRLIEYLTTNKFGVFVFIIWATGVILLLSFAITACNTLPKSTAFDGKWEFVETAPGEMKLCLKQEDIAKLKKLLIRCQAGAN